MAKKIKWEYGVWKEWLPEITQKMWHADDGCYKIFKIQSVDFDGYKSPNKFRLQIGWTDIGWFKRVEDAKKTAQLIKNG